MLNKSAVCRNGRPSFRNVMRERVPEAKKEVLDGRIMDSQREFQQSVTALQMTGGRCNFGGGERTLVYLQGCRYLNYLFLVFAEG